MRISPRIILLVLYIFLFIFLFSNVLTGVPINEHTLPYIAVIALVFLCGLALLLAWDYIIPTLIRSYKLGECKVEDKKYLICRYKTTPELIGYIVVKVIPTQPIADMDRERRLSYLDAIQGLLSGSHYEVIVAYVGVKDRYQETIRERLLARKQRLLTFSFRETPAMREELASIDRELRIIEQVPVILEGFYIAMAREYATDEDELKRKLEADGRALVSMLSKMGVKAVIIEGEELRSILSYMLFGSVVQTTF